MLMTSNWNHKNKSNQMNFIAIVLIVYWPHKTTHKKVIGIHFRFSELFKHNNSTELWPKCAKFHFMHRSNSMGYTFPSFLKFWFTRTARKNSIPYECCNPNCIRSNKNIVSCWVVGLLKNFSSRPDFFFSSRSFQINSYGSSADKNRW